MTNRPDIALALIPCSEKLWDLEDRLADPLALPLRGQMRRRWRSLTRRLRAEFDVVVVDTPPGRSFFGRVAMDAADLIIVPCDATKLAVRAMAVFARELENRQLNGKARLLWTKHRGIDEIRKLEDELSSVLSSARVSPFPSLLDSVRDENLGGLLLSPVFSKGVVRTDARSFESVYNQRSGVVARALAEAVLAEIGLEH